MMKKLSTYIIEKFKISKNTNLTEEEFLDLKELIVNYLKKKNLNEKDYKISFIKQLFIHNLNSVQIDIVFKKVIDSNASRSWQNGLCRIIDKKTKYEWSSKNSSELDKHIYISVVEKDEKS